MSELNSSPNFPGAILSVSRQELDEVEMEIVDGTLPADLQGHVFITAICGFVNSHAISGTPIVVPPEDGIPVINGDGMICRLDFHHKGQASQPGKVWLKTKLAGTPSFWADVATVEEEYTKYKFHNFGVARISEFLGARNVVNTAWLPFKLPGEGDRLLVTLDAGRAYEIDPTSLEIVTPIGRNNEWREQLKLGVPFKLIMSTAHPYFDPRTQEMFTVNFTQSFLSLLPPQFKRQGEVLDDILPRIGDALKIVEWLLEEFDKWIDNWSTRHQTTRLMGLGTADVAEVEEFSQETIASFRRKEEEISDGDVPETFKEFLHELPLIIKSEIDEAEDLADVKDFLDELLQLVRVGSTFLSGIKDMEDAAYLIRWNGKDDFENWQLVLPDGSPVEIKQTMHQIGVTQDYLVLMDTSLKIGLSQLIVVKNKKIDALIRRIINYPQSPETSIYIVSRADLNSGQKEVVAQKIVIPMEVFHFLVDYDNPGSRITLHASHASAWDVAEWLRREDTPLTDNPQAPVGMVVSGMDVNHLGRYYIDAKNGTLCESAVTTNFDANWAIAIWAYSNQKMADGSWYPPAKFDNIYWGAWGAWEDLLSKYIAKIYEDYEYRDESVAEVKQATAQGKPSNICRLDTETMEVADVYQFPPGYFGNSPQFVPRANGSGDSTDGYILCTVIYDNGDRAGDVEIGTSEIWIFDAQDFHRGEIDPVWGIAKPLCRLRHPQFKFGFTTHSTWLPKIAPRTPGIYRISIREDYEEIVKQQEPEIQQIFEEKVYPHFPD
ncbi:MAG: carotenoid oxygenase family protein [Calothrix sp. MO_192.B10]|nr:carotenoid oxygenase family protein [Calothrix sp. MO_192.B10]